MAITPISIPGLSRNPTGVEAIVARGTSVLGSILRDATQIGRDQANNQARAERDFLTEQRREINLTQRRAENLQTQTNADRRFEEDTRQFDIKFGEDQRQFNFRADQMEEGGLRDDRRLGLAEQSAAVNQQVALGGLQLRREANQLQQEDNALRREERQEDRALRKEVSAISLEQARLNLREAQGEEARRAAKSAYDKALAAEQGTALAEMDRLIQSGDTEAATSFYRTTIENPNLGLPEGARKRFGSALGIGTTATRSQAETPVDSLDLAAVDAELATLNDAKGVRDGAAPTEKTAIRMAALQRRKTELEKQTPAGRKSIAETLLDRGRAGR